MYQRQYQTLCLTFTHALLAKEAIFFYYKDFGLLCLSQTAEASYNLMHLLVVFAPRFWDYTCALSRNRRMGAQALLSLFIANLQIIYELFIKFTEICKLLQEVLPYLLTK